MNAIELNQIMASAVGLVRYRFPEGPMLSLDQLFSVLNTHCQEAAIVTVENEGKPNGYRVQSYQTENKG